MSSEGDLPDRIKLRRNPLERVIVRDEVNRRSREQSNRFK